MATPTGIGEIGNPGTPYREKRNPDKSGLFIDLLRPAATCRWHGEKVFKNGKIPKNRYYSAKAGSYFAE
jgi:hypothetical protein